MTQSEFRSLIKEYLADALDENEMFELADIIVGDFESGNKALDKAASEVYYGLDDALKKLSRMAVRLGYLPKESK